MKKIQLRYLAKGKRTTNIDMHGFEGLANKPIAGFAMDGGQPLKTGDITSAYTVMIPPDNLFEIIDTQNNRMQLRKATMPSERWDVVLRYNEETGKQDHSREKIIIDPAFKVIGDTDIWQDIAPTGKAYTEEEVQARIAEALEQKNVGVKKEKTKVKIDEPIIADVIDEPDISSLEVKEPKVNRWAKKVAPVG